MTIDPESMQFRGETGAQSSIMPVLVGLMKIPHRSSLLTQHLTSLGRYMPAAHQALIRSVEAMPSLKPIADKAIFDWVLDAMAGFREVHYGWAREYIARRPPDPKVRGGTPYMTWLKQLIDETRQWQR